ncbi:helicase HerA domain-containing protein [Methanocaldococcus sp.]
MNVEHIAVLGMTGTGKTYFIKKYLIEPAKRRGKRVIILDLERDYSGFTLKNFKALKEALKEHRVVRILTEEYQSTQMQSEIYDYIFSKIRNCMIVIDEIHNQGGQQGKIDDNLIKLITRGRKRGLKLVVASQRPSLVDKIILSNCGTLVLKKVGWATDWNVYKEVSKEAVDILKSSKSKYATVIIRNGTIWRVIE